MLQPSLQHAAQQQFSARQQRAVHLLQMPNTEFQATVLDTLASNPFLDMDEQDAAALPDDAPAAGTGLWGSPGATERRMGGGDDAVDALSFVPTTTTLQEHLQAQLRLRRLPDRQFLLACLLCEALDDDGYLRGDPAEVVTQAGLSPAASAGELREALAAVQSLEPAGVGARSLVECLALQLPAALPPQDRGLCVRLLTDAESGLRARDASRCAHALGCDVATVQRLLRILRTLDPHPGWRVGGEPVRYVVPDVVARRTRRGWTAVLNDAVVPRLQLNRGYADLYRQRRVPSDAAMTGQLNEARWTLRNLAQRYATILDVAQAIVRQQQNFLEHGALAMQPLVLRQIAEELGMHESTVSRVTHQKYIATPSGTFELNYFFSRGLPVAGGGQCSPTAVRELVHEIIVRERGQPLSDGAIAQQLARRGIQVARRTVTKYRQQLGLVAAGQRSGTLMQDRGAWHAAA